MPYSPIQSPKDSNVFPRLMPMPISRTSSIVVISLMMPGAVCSAQAEGSAAGRSSRRAIMIDSFSCRNPHFQDLSFDCARGCSGEGEPVEGRDLSVRIRQKLEIHRVLPDHAGRQGGGLFVFLAGEIQAGGHAAPV